MNDLANETKLNIYGKSAIRAAFPSLYKQLCKGYSQNSI